MTTNFIEQIKEDLKSFASTSPLDAAKNLLSRLGVRYSTVTDDPIDIGELYKKAAASVKAEIPKSVKAVFDRIETSWFLGGVSEETFVGTETQTSFETASEKAGDQKHNGMFIFLLRMKDGAPLTRTDAAQLTRGINRVMKSKPATVFIVEGQGDKTLLSIATCERTTYKQDWRPGEKLGRVSILKGINCASPHRGHLDILASMDVKKCKTFDALYAQWQKVFSTDLLTKSFYHEIQDWYFWAMSKYVCVQFPNDLDDNTDDEKYNAENLIRLITRMLFTWFMKAKGLVNPDLFELSFLKTALKHFDPEASVEDSNEKDAEKKCTYYRAILQNLFFATFNQKIAERKFVEDFDKKKGSSAQYKIKCYYRNAKLFTETDPQKILGYFAESPFVNGGLFECLDNVTQCDKKKKEHEYSWDGFSTAVHFGEGSRKGALKSALIPDCLFFGSKRIVDLSSFYEDCKNRKSAERSEVRGLVNILNDYVFTIEENTPLDEDVALDPELLGKVFENLLGAYNPETKQMARNATGSFYTPRAIVEYMVQESVKAYLDRKVPAVPTAEIEKLVDGREDISQMPSVQEHSEEILLALFNLRILDPACGSGAFPMGIMTEIVSILTKVDPTNQYWHKIVLHESLEEAKKVGAIKDEAAREKKQKEIEAAFDTRSRHSDYARKLYVIQHCIFGSDIQPIAVQISRLRFFITLLCEQTKTNDRSDNYGIVSLPNLEQHFVSANSLLSIDIGSMRDVFSPRQVRDRRTKAGKNDCVVEARKQAIIAKVEELRDVRGRLFLPKTKEEKADLEERDAKLRKEIGELARDLYDKQSQAELKCYEDELAKQTEMLESLSEDSRHDRMEIKTEMGLFGPMSEKVVIKSQAKEIESRIRDLQFKIEDIKSEGRKHRLLNDVLRLVKWNPFSFNISEDFLDPEWMFNVKDGFDIVIGNPPYGASLSAEDKAQYKKTYQTAKTIRGVQKGSIDTYTLFIERGYDLLSQDGVLSYIVPISFTSSDALTGVHRLLFSNCSMIRISSYAVRPQPVFENAVVNTSIISFKKDGRPCEKIYSTKMYRKGEKFDLNYLVKHLEFAEVKDLCLRGRIPKIGKSIERSILGKVFDKKNIPIGTLIRDSGGLIVYRFAGGRYFKVITNYSNGSSAEREIFFDKKISDAIGCILSSNLSFWFYQVYSDNLNWKTYEIESFTVPQLTDEQIAHLDELYARYLADIEKNANQRATSGVSSYSIDSFKEYKIGKSKEIIDKIDDFIGPLYGLSREEIEFVKNYEIEFRLSGED